MVNIVGIRFKKNGKIYYFAPGDLEVKLHDHVIVKTTRGLEYGEVVLGPKMVPESEIVSPLKEIIRIATEADQKKFAENQEAFQAFLKATGFLRELSDATSIVVNPYGNVMEEQA